ncbi:hypothetical protein EUX98_g4405 [Antrodiella citrinella]|uniref:Uncharacterized protein n=1 Tax=Antrodiella citrinella TaxID=2447956 RepID=A0A4S4MWK2_9APHY|nr:hypothetical protein EUX98_g4405 [Antrodiella citrinella]
MMNHPDELSTPPLVDDDIQVSNLQLRLYQAAWRIQSSIDAIRAVKELTPNVIKIFRNGILRELADAQTIIGCLGIVCGGWIWLFIPAPIGVVASHVHYVYPSCRPRCDVKHLIAIDMGNLKGRVREEGGYCIDTARPWWTDLTDEAISRSRVKRSGQISTPVLLESVTAKLTALASICKASASAVQR